MWWFSGADSQGPWLPEREGILVERRLGWESVRWVVDDEQFHQGREVG